MSKQNVFGRTPPTVTGGFTRGLAQMASMGRLQPVRVVTARSVTEALRGDWARIGGDMGRAIEKVRASGETIKPK